MNSLAELEDAGNDSHTPRNPVLASKRSGYVNVRDGNGTVILKAMSMGHHENYYSPVLAGFLDSTIVKRNAASLSSYLSTRGVWAGVGIVADDGYRTTQKFEATRFTKHISRTIHGGKPPFVRHTSDNRLEVLLGDGNMSSERAAEVIDLTSLVMRMLEHNKFPEELLVPYPDLAMRDSSVPGGMIRTNSGEMTGANHQQCIAEATLEFADGHKNTPEHEIAAAQHVAEICRYVDLFDGSMGTLELISNDVEWAAKLLYIRKHVGERAVITAANLEAVRYDLRWEDISPTRSPSRKWYARHGDPFSKAEILRAATKPPRTRALARTAALHSGLRPAYIDWASVRTRQESFSQPDPYDYTLPQN